MKNFLNLLHWEIERRAVKNRLKMKLKSSTLAGALLISMFLLMLLLTTLCSKEGLKYIEEESEEMIITSPRIKEKSYQERGTNEIVPKIKKQSLE